MRGALPAVERTLRDREDSRTSGTGVLLGRVLSCRGGVREIVRLVPKVQGVPTREGRLMDRCEVQEPWSDVSADLMEFSQSKSRNKYFIVFGDFFTRWVEVKPVPNATGIAVQKALEDLVVFRWGTPRRLVVDNGSKFDNKRIAEMVKCYGIELVANPPYHHRANP